MSASNQGEDEEVAGSFIAIEHLHRQEESDLLKAHSYTILKVVEVLGFHIINMRNPWG